MGMKDEEPMSKYESFTKVIKDIDDIKLILFLEDGGYITKEASAITSALDMITSVHIASNKQTTHEKFLICTTILEPITFFHA